MKRIFSIVAALLFFSSPSIKAQSDAGAIFLLISPGARAGGMGEAQVAVANDAYASYWNPAGLAFLQWRPGNKPTPGLAGSGRDGETYRFLLKFL